MSRIENYRVQRERARLDTCNEDTEIVATPELELWPAKLREVRAFVCCGRGLYLLDNLQVRRLANGSFYGLTRYGDYHYVFHRHSREAGSIYRFTLNDGRIICNKRFFVGLSGGVHQIDFIGDRLFVADSYRNEIVILDRNGRLVKRLYPLGKLTNGRQSSNYGHLNSVYAVGDNIYVLAHNETYKTDKKSEILVILRSDLSVADSIGAVGSCAHNIVTMDGLFLVCDSLDGTLKNCNEVVFRPSTFVRGLALNDDFIVLGGSVYSERGKRMDNDVFVYFLNRRFELLGTMRIKDAAQVHEIRLLGDDYGFSNTNAADSTPDNHLVSGS